MSAAPQDRDALLKALAEAAEHGHLRWLDLSLARLLAELDPAAPASLLLAAALLSRLESQGHVCMDLAAMTVDPLAVLGWPADVAPALRAWVGQLPARGEAARALWVDARQGATAAAAQAPSAEALSRMPAMPAGARPPSTGAPEVIVCTPVLEWVDAGNSAADPQTPLVLEGDRLYLRRYRALECAVAQRLAVRAARPVERVSLADTGAWLDRLFGPAPDASGVSAEPDWQRRACERALQRAFTLITGGPGTGKTYTAARLLVLLQALHAGPVPLRIGLAAPTGKAAARLRQSIEHGLQGLSERLGSLPAIEAAAALPAARTLHALLGVRPRTRRFAHDEQHPLALDVLLVDEASMVHLELMDALLRALPPGARLILLGDSEQLASVEAGSVLGDLCAAGPGTALAQQTVRLRLSRRFGGPIGQAAQAVNAGDAAALTALLSAGADPVRGPVSNALSGAPVGAPGEASRDALGDVLHDAPLRRLRLLRGTSAGGTPAGAAELARWALMGGPRSGAVSSASAPPSDPGPNGGLASDSSDATLAPGHAGWLQRLRQRPRDRAAFEPWALSLIRRFEAFRVLCALREGPRGVAGLNELIEREAAARGWLQRRGAWYEGRPVMVTRNDAGLKLFNGDIGLVLRAPSGSEGEGGLRAWFAEGDTLRSVAVNRLPDVETAFAMTVHKSQGSEFEHVLLVLPDDDLPVLTRELLYTGITRARRWLTLALSDDAVLAQAAGRRTWRMSGLPGRLG